ncbi:hypothetical protein [Allorhizocola rhizosphaerae]|uniref:hypothetical protein n=1 Tax=Allorhizocola rhizosphaerae TaxID=1872709 RepID=UPI000E3E4FF8|nr:hypothetical protein [Allorhizocola rhizosphaerae]
MTTQATPPADADLDTIRAFITRARRIESHSLAADKQSLLRWSSQQIHVQVDDNGQGIARWDLPPEEALESLAARMRPLLLKTERLYYAKVLDAIDHRVATDPELADAAVGLRAEWAKLDRDSPDLLAYRSQTGEVGGELGAAVNDKKLAYAWIYGDLVHADDVTTRAAGHNLDYRYQGAAGLITIAAVACIATLNLVRAAQARGLLGLEPELFTARVSPRTTAEVKLARLVMAPVGTPAEDMTALLDNHGDQPQYSAPDSSPSSGESRSG